MEKDIELYKDNISKKSLIFVFYYYSSRTRKMEEKSFEFNADNCHDLLSGPNDYEYLSEAMILKMMRAETTKTTAKLKFPFNIKDSQVKQVIDEISITRKNIYDIMVARMMDKDNQIIDICRKNNYGIFFGDKSLKIVLEPSKKIGEEFKQCVGDLR